jgi:NADH-quinone oxidoreductase subunit C
MKTIEFIKNLKTELLSTIVEVQEFLSEVTLDVKKQGLKALLSFLKESGYEVLMDLTGVDYIHPEKRTKVVYWLHNPHNFERIRVCLFVSRDEVIPSVTAIWKGADWYERELYDLFGVKFEGHPDLKRLLMPDDWVGHPLRKDYALKEESVEFKHEARPKIPSQIINLKRNQKLL